MFRQIHSSIWAEPWFEPLSSDAKLLYLYLLSSSLTTPSGFLTASPKRISLECCLTLESIPTASAALVDSGRVLYWPELNLYWLKKFSRWQGSLKNEKWIKHVGDSLKGLPDCAITAFISEYPTDTLPIPYPYPTDRWNTTEQNNTTQNRPKQTNKTVPPPSPPTATTTAEDNDFARVTSAYENNIGLITSITGDTLRDSLTLYPADWICEAIATAVKAEKRNWLYCDAILKRWKAEGKNSQKPNRKDGHNGASEKSSASDATIRALRAAQEYTPR